MKRRVTSFLLVFFSFMAVVLLYMGIRLAERPWHWILLLLLGFFLSLLPTMHWRSESGTWTGLKRRLQQITFLSMGYMSWLFIVTLSRDLVVLLTFFFLPHQERAWVSSVTKGSAALGAALVLSLLGIAWGYRGLRVRNIKVFVSSLPEMFAGLRVAQVSDLHIGPMIGGDYVRKVVERVNSLKSDITVLTGDIVDGAFADFKEVAAVLAGLEPKGKVFFVPGNHEYYWAIEEWIKEFKKWGIRVLLNEGDLLEIKGHRVWIGGVTDAMATQWGEDHAPSPAKALRGGETADFKLLLSHRPDPFQAAADSGFHLQLSGHTHGGQFFPWNIVVRFFHQYYIGLMKHQDMWIYVSPGTGSWGPPMRFGTTSEVTALDITGP
jgi:predicted MPP superfamily phosphohydrolase